MAGQSEHIGWKPRAIFEYFLGGFSAVRRLKWSSPRIDLIGRTKLFLEMHVYQARFRKPETEAEAEKENETFSHFFFIRVKIHFDKILPNLV